MLLPNPLIVHFRPSAQRVLNLPGSILPPHRSIVLTLKGRDMWSCTRADYA